FKVKICLWLLLTWRASTRALDHLDPNEAKAFPNNGPFKAVCLNESTVQL
uniref:Uncharacterized protein n=1 Tax=Nothoprocta perdicaria TaxID=30464 RepID=A0A8C6ZW95_NOTPE